MIRLGTALIALALTTAIALVTLVVTFILKREGRPQRRVTIAASIIAIAGIVAGGGLTLALTLKVGAKGRDVARSVYNRTATVIRTDSDGCPRGFPLDGPQKRLEVISCTSPTNPIPRGVRLQRDAPELYLLDDYIPMNPDGKYLAVLQATPSATERILADPPPWGGTWTTDPLPADALPGLEWFADTDYGLGTSGTIRYAIGYLSPAAERPEEHGNFVAVDPATNRVWFAYWDS